MPGDALRILASGLVLAALAGSALGQEPPVPEKPAATAAAQHAPPAPPRPRRAGAGERALAVTWEAPAALRALFEKYLPPPAPVSEERRAIAVRAWIRNVKKRVPEIAASEGYFSASVEVRFEGERRERAIVSVTPGERTLVDTVAIEFAGDLAGEGAERAARREQLRGEWAMRAGAPFRSADWESAKTRIQESLADIDYAAGTLGASQATVDAQAARAHLKVVLDSGPPFTLGEVTIVGLERYPESVVRRSVDLKRGERYRRERLAELQRKVQNGPWFSSVVVDIERDRSRSEQVPVKMTVTERARQEIGLALGYGTDDGARAETAYRYRNLFARGFDLQSSIRAGQREQIGYADVYLPPGLIGERHGEGIPFTDSFGVLAEHSTIQKLALSRFAVAGYRHFTLESVETRVGLSYQVERSFPEGSDPRIQRALAPVASVTWRHVDNLYDPRRGGVLNVQFAAGAKHLASGDDFLKAYVQYQYWIPLSPMDQLVLRSELGRTFTPSREHIPEDFLFRAGGSRSNRGYAYQSLGAHEGDAIVGGRFLATGTAEYVHWLNDKWGGAVFVDAGDAADAARDLRVNTSYGFGARYKTPAGPLALDLAYAQRDSKLRLSFSVTVAF